VLTDYTPPCGAGVAGSITSPTPPLTNNSVLNVPLDNTNAASTSCQTTGPQLGLAGGLSARYAYDSLWGSFALVGAVFGGVGDGGPVTAITPALSPTGTGTGTTPILNAGNGSVDAPRIYLSWINSWRPLQRLDLFANVVLDLYGSGGPQLTRVVALGTLRLLNDDRLTLRLSYSHLSSLAINMYLSNMVYNRLAGTIPGIGASQAVENNLTVLRTARDEERVSADIKLVRRLGAYLEARLRDRGVMDSSSNPAVFNTPAYNDNTADLAYDITAGLRDSGTLGGIRAGLSYTYLQNFRALNHVLAFNLGRDFLNERLTFDLGYTLAVTADAGANLATPSDCSPSTPFLIGCFGQRSGMNHEIGLMVTTNPWRRLFLLLDYRFTALLTDAQNMVAIPTVLSHSILLRAEYRW
jgi:hypothetical protein